MRLLYTPNPEYVHKVLVVAHEAGVLDRLEFERQVPFDPDTEIQKYNPLGKVPALVLDNGEALYGGILICEFLDSLSVTGKSVFPSGAEGWTARRQMVLGDGLFDATTNMRVESWRGPDAWHEDYLARERAKIVRALDQMEKDAQHFEGGDFHIGHVGFVGGLSYLNLRNPVREVAMEPGDADFDWRTGREHLAQWFEGIQSRPSVAFRMT